MSTQSFPGVNIKENFCSLFLVGVKTKSNSLGKLLTDIIIPVIIGIRRQDSMVKFNFISGNKRPKSCQNGTAKMYSNELL